VKKEKQNAQKKVVITFLPGIQVYVGLQESIKKRFGDSMPAKISKMLGILASRTGVEPVPPP